MSSRCYPTCGNVLNGKQTNPDVAVDIPLLALTVRLTAVIHESRKVPLGACIDYPTAHIEDCEMMHQNHSKI